MNKTIKALALTAVLALMGAAPVLADDAAPTVKVNGMVDSYITYNFNNGADDYGNQDTYWNTANNNFSLGLAEAKITATMGKATGVVELAYQDDPELALPSGNQLDVLQAYGSYSDMGFTVTAGRFATWIGYEVIEPTGNVNYSHSLLFWYTIPLWNQGLSVNYTTSDSVLSVSGYATDGWNTISNSGLGFTYGGQVAVTPNSDWKFIANGIVGPGVDANDDFGPFYNKNRWVAELIANYNGVKNLTLGLDATYGGQDFGFTATGYPINGTTPTDINSLDIWGVALYGKYQVASDWSVAVRLENVTDIESFYGLTGSDWTNSVQEGTLTVTHNLTPQFSILAEGRYDYAIVDGKVPTPGNGPYGPNGSADQLTATAAAVYSF